MPDKIRGAPAGPLLVAEMPAPLRGVLPLLRRDAAAHFGLPEIALEGVALQERLLSYVLRMRVCRLDGGTPLPHLFVKVFKTRPQHSAEEMQMRVTRDFEFTQRTYDAFRQWDEGGTVCPVVCYPEQLAIVTEETRGATLAVYVDRGARWFPSRRTLEELEQVVERVGRWVHHFQAIDPGPGTISLPALRDYIDLRVSRMVSEPLAGWSGTDRDHVLAHVDQVAARVAPDDLTEVTVHADLAPGNVLVAGSRIVVLDFAMTRRGNRMHDIARLYTQLELLRAKPQFRRGTVRCLTRALLRGFDSELTDRAPLFRLLLLLHRINHLNTLAVRHEQFPSSVYNAHLRRLHRRWIAAEVASPK